MGIKVQPLDSYMDREEFEENFAMGCFFFNYQSLHRFHIYLISVAAANFSLFKYSCDGTAVVIYLI